MDTDLVWAQMGWPFDFWGEIYWNRLFLACKNVHQTKQSMECLKNTCSPKNILSPYTASGCKLFVSVRTYSYFLVI